MAYKQKCKNCKQEYEVLHHFAHYWHIYGFCIGKNGKYGCICGCSMSDSFDEMAELSWKHSGGRYAYPINLVALVPKKVELK